MFDKVEDLLSSHPISIPLCVEHQMGEVGTNSADNSHADLKMNGGINGSCDDELNAMEIDTSNTSNESIVKNADNSDVQTTADSNAMELDCDGNSHDVSKTSGEVNTIDENDHEQKSDQNQDNIESMSHENGATQEEEEETKKTCDDEKHGDDEEEDEIPDSLMEKNEVICDDIPSKIIEESDSTVKVLSDPLSMDVEFINDEKRTNHSRPKSTENGTSATIMSSNDKGECNNAVLFSIFSAII